MPFINIQAQNLFFQAHQARREKRIDIGVIASEEHSMLLDKCLDIILCHDPDIWSKGTGILLVARIKEFNTLSQKRALIFRINAKKCHASDRKTRPLMKESFGFFVRKTLEYRNRIRNYAYHNKKNINKEMLEIINYIETVSPVFENFFVQAEMARKTGIKRHGKQFDNLRQVTKKQSIFQLIEEISSVIDGRGSYFLYLLQNSLNIKLCKEF
jgi:hypothetical protein